MLAAPELRWRFVLVLELLAYALLAGGFLWMYVIRFHEPGMVVPYHVRLLLTLLILLWALRAMVWAGGRARRGAVGLAGLLFILPLVLLAAWYFVVLIGLDAWGRVTTWQLIKTYVIQAPHLLGVLGVSPWIPMTVFFVSAFGLLLLVLRYVARHDWVRELVVKGSRTGVSIIAVALMSLAALLVHMQTEAGRGHPREPIALSFFASKFNGLQSHLVSDSPALAEREESARRSYEPALARARRNLVVIVGDALRSDHMSIYGYGRDTTPKLAALVRDHGAVVLPNMRSACAESSCGLMAMAASRPVAEIGPTPLTMQEILRRNGYQVHFILGGDHTNFYGLDRMYGELDSFFDGSQQSRRYMNDDQLVLDRVAALPKAPVEQAVAFQFHLMSTHGLGRREPHLARFQPSTNYYAWPGGSPRRPPTPVAAAGGVNYYDNGVLGFDSVVSQLLAVLEEKGYLDNALVVITGDHGEMLGERGFFSHQYGVSEQVLDIPLVLFRYGYTGAEFPSHPWSGQIDIAPTILHELSIPAPAIWRGRALQQPWVPREYVVQQARHFGIYQIGDEGRVLKYERDLASGEERVIDPVVDPLGLRDLRAEVPSQMLVSWRARSASSMLSSTQKAW